MMSVINSGGSCDRRFNEFSNTIAAAAPAARGDDGGRTISLAFGVEAQ